MKLDDHIYGLQESSVSRAVGVAVTFEIPWVTVAVPLGESTQVVGTHGCVYMLAHAMLSYSVILSVNCMLLSSGQAFYSPTYPRLAAPRLLRSAAWKL